MKVLAVVPACNESENMPLIIKGLQAQDYPTTICIVANNCHDNTVQVARDLEADIVTEMSENKSMRSGAINWGIEHFGQDADYILAIDADSTIAPDAVSQGIKALENDSTLGAVCSRAGVLPLTNLGLIGKLLWHIQHIEYGTYDSSRVETTPSERNRGIKIAHGLATIYRMEALKQQKAKHGHIYNPKALCEDYWLTLDLKELGWNISSCQKMDAWTIVPTTFGELRNQRVRWCLGAVDALMAHGLNPLTAWDWFAHVMSIILLGVEVYIIRNLILQVMSGESVYASWLFKALIVMMGLTGLYRLKYCQSRTIWDLLIQVTLIPQILFSYFERAFQLEAYGKWIWTWLTGKTQRSY